MSANRTSVIEYIIKADQAHSEARALNNEMDNIGRSAQRAGVTGTAALNGIERSGRSAGVAGAQLDQIYQNVVRTQGAGSKTALELASAMGIGAKASQASAVATETLAVGTVKAEQGLFRLTNMINTGQGPLRGYDGLVQALIRSVGGIPVIWAVMIPIALALADALFKLGDAKKEQIKLDNEQIELDIRRQASLNTGTLFTKEYARTLHDTNALNVDLKKSNEALLVAQAQEADAIAKTSTTAKDYAASTGDLQTKIAAYTIGLFTQVKTEREATAVRIEATKVLNEQIIERIKLAVETGKTRDALIAELQAILGNTDAMKGLIAALDEGALAQARLRAGRGLIGDVRTQVAEEAAAAGVTLTHAEALRRFNAELVKRGDATVKLGAETVLAEKNLKAFNNEHVRGSGAARAYANALVDLQARVKDAEAALTLDALSLQRFRITTQIEKEREHLAINKRDRQAASDALTQLEKAQLALVNREWAISRAARLATDREFRAKEVAEWSAHFVKQRQSREEEERKFFENQTKIEAEARANRPLRRQLEAQQFGVDKGTADDLRAVQDAFNGAARSAAMYQLQLDLASGKSVSFSQVSKAMFSELFVNVQSAIVWFTALGGALGNLFEGLVTGTSSAKALILRFIAELLTSVGSMAIAVGTILIFLPPWLGGNPGLGAGLIAAGVAALALAGVLRGLATNAQQSASGAGVSGGAGASGGSGAATTSPPGVPNIIPFPTSPQTIVIVNKFDRGGLKAAMKGEEFITTSDLRENSGVKRTIRKVVG